MSSLRPAQTEYLVTRLKQLVDSRDLTQDRLHELSGIAQPIISNIFRRTTTPSKEHLEAIARALASISALLL